MRDWKEFHQRMEAVVAEKPHSAVVELVDTLRKNNCSRVLDHGCGTGRHVFYLRDKGFEVWGIDNSDYATQRLKERGADSQYVVEAHISQLPFVNHWFDALISINVLGHGNLEQVTQYMSEIKRVVRPRGLVLLSVPSIRFLEQNRTPETREISSGTYVGLPMPDGEFPHHFYTTDEMEGLFPRSEILTNKHIEEPDPLMDRMAHHIIFVCKLGEYQNG